MNKNITILIMLVTLTLISGCINLSSRKINSNLEAKTFYNENDKENYFTIYPYDMSFVYIEMEKDGSQTFDLSKVGNYRIIDNNIFLSIPAGIVLRGKIVNETTIIDSQGIKWIKE